MNEEASAGEVLPRGLNLASAKKRRVRRMTENYASKSALDREGSLLDNSERFGLPPGPRDLSSQLIGVRGGRAVTWPHKMVGN